ncbi:MAG: hypothetical protein R8K49_09195 [Mariprofundaceae bacterium]
MAITYPELKAYLNHLGVSEYYEQKNPQGGIAYIGASFKSGDDDEKPETVFIELQENGEFLRLFEPQRYSLAGCQYRDAVLQELLKMNYEMKMLKWEFDPNDGEIRASIELPIEDGTLTLKQFNRALTGLINMMDQSHERIQKVMQFGEV